MATAAYLPKIVALPAPFFLRLFALLALAPAAFSLTYVSSCSVLSTPGEQYVLTQNVSFAAGNCMNITANGITLDCNGYTVDGSLGYYGIFVNVANNSTARNCNLQNCSIYVLGSAAVKLDNITCSGGLTLDSSSSNGAISNFQTSSGIHLYSDSSNNVFTNVTTTAADFGITLSGGCRSNTFINVSTNATLGIWLLTDSDVDNRFYNCSNSLEYNTSGDFWGRFFSGSGAASNITSSGNIGWWPKLTSNGSDATSPSQTAWYNGTQGGRNADWTVNSSLQYWYNNSGGGEGGSATYPAVSLNSPANGVNISNSTVTLNWTPQNFSADPDCNVTSDSSLIFSGTCTNNTACTTLNATVDGNYSWNVTCYQGSENATSATRTFTVDTASPIVSIQNPANATYNTSTLALNFTASDSGSGIGACWYSLDGGSNTSLANCGNASVSSLPDGSRSITVYANDSAGNTASSTVYFTVNMLKTKIGLTIRNKDLRPSYLNGISLNGDYVSFDPPIDFATGETRIITFSLTEAYCNYTGQLLQFDVVILYYRQGQISGMAQTGSIPLMAKCS